jgi:branched-chain amino acid transport system ATP-binding protein
MALLELSDLAAGYGHIPVLREVSLAVDDGELLVVLGPNGAGKTTLLRAISGMCQVTGGEVRIEGDSIRGRTVEQIVHAGVAHVPEGRRLFTRQRVWENLDLGVPRAFSRQRQRARLEYVHDLFPILGQRRSQVTATLSGGEQQMLAIGRALMAEPRLLLLDEPSAGLAPAVYGEVLGAIERVRGDGTAVLLVEQTILKSFPDTTRCCLLGHGQVMAETTLGDARSNADQVTAHYFEAP